MLNSQPHSRRCCLALTLALFNLLPLAFTALGAAGPERWEKASQAFFCRNDFFPFTRDELKRHDPEIFELLARLWGVSSHLVPSFTKETP